MNFSSALSAMTAMSTALDSVGNNLANLSTVGYKATTVSFEELVAKSVGAGAVAKILQNFTQGSIQSTSGPLDAAIQGNGFFVVKDKLGRSLLTRAGNFQVDASGNLTMTSGEKVQGWNLGGVLGDLSVAAPAVKPPQATTSFTIDANMDASAPTGTQFSSSVQTVDSLGNPVVVTIDFTKNAAANTWDYSVSIPSGTASSTPSATGSLVFDKNGSLVIPLSAPAVNNQIPITITGLNDGAKDLSLNWNLVKADGTTGRLTQVVAPSAVSANDQNGYSAAQFKQVVVDTGGKIMAEYSNGARDEIGQLAVASVGNPNSLIPAGNCTFQVAADTAQPAVGTSGTGGRGTVVGGALEASTVDIAREFTNLITYQRSFQASARMVTVTDELTQDTINLKR